MSKTIRARLANQPMDYQKLGIKKEIAPWEDGIRTGGTLGEYEWWYFDGKMEDGSSLVITFYTSPMTAMTNGFDPSAAFSLTLADGTEVKDEVRLDISHCSFAADHCCAKVGNCVFEGDLKDYHIHFEGEKILADVTLHGNAASWRPETGYLLFGEKKYFAWLPSVPEGSVEAAITARKKYGYAHFPIFLLAKNGQKLGDNPKYLTYTQTDAQIDPVTGKYFHRTLIYDYNDGTQHYRVTYKMQDYLAQLTAANVNTAGAGKISAPLKIALKLAGLDPSYTRVVGTVTLERFENGEVAEYWKSPGLWEQMYFGMNEDV